MNFLDYDGEWERSKASLSERERELLQPLRLTAEEAQEMARHLAELGFVKCEGGTVTMGNQEGLACKIEGRRLNEEPRRAMVLPPFYVCTTTVTNMEYEAFDRRYSRAPTSPGDTHPATCMSYARAISYALFLNEQTGMKFSLPTEPQAVLAMAPESWQYPHRKDGRPARKEQNVYKSYPDAYVGQMVASTLPVDSDLVPTNYLGLRHATGNVSIFTLGHYPTTGHWGAQSDGSYCMAVGGNFRTCPLGSRTVTRGIIDVAGTTDTIGIRLVHPDPYLYVKE